MSRAILFDIDGVLIRSFDDRGRFLWSATIEQDLGIGGDVMKEIFSKGWLECICGRADTRSYFHSILAPRGHDVDAFIDYWLSNDNNYNDDVMTCLKGLQGRGVYMATNQEPLRKAHLAKTIGHLFEGIFTSSDIGAMKPEEGFFAHVEKALGVAPQNITFFDDIAANVEMAQKRGWDAHVYRGPDDLQRLAA